MGRWQLIADPRGLPSPGNAASGVGSPAAKLAPQCAGRIEDAMRNGKSRPPIVAECLMDDQDAASLIAATTPTERVVWLSRNIRTRVRVLPRVAAGEFTTMAQEGEVYRTADQPVWAVQWTVKAGRYDGRERTELIVRQLPHHQADGRPWGEVKVRHGKYVTTVSMTYGGRHLARAVVLRRLPDTGEHDPARCLLWHWTKYYYMIPRHRAEEMAAEFAVAFGGCSDLNALNREASRALYAEARATGWRKLTARERTKYGVDGQWHHVDDLAVRLGHPAGVGEYTAAAAAGLPIHST